MCSVVAPVIVQNLALLGAKTDIIKIKILSNKKEVKICQIIHRGLMIVSVSIAITFLMVNGPATLIWTLMSWSVQSAARKWA